jgi:hypothetical protein
VIDELFGAGMEGITDPAARVARLFRVSARFNADDRSYGRFLSTLVIEGFRNPELAPLAGGEVERFRSFYADAVRDAVAAGVAIADPGALVDLLVAVQWGLGLFAAFIGDPERLAAAVAVVADEVAPGLLGAGP